MSFAQELKDFTGGLQAGWKLGKPDKEAYADKWRQEDYARIDANQAKIDAEKAKEPAALQAGENDATPGAVGYHPTVSGGAIPTAAPSFAAGSGGGGAGRAMRLPQATDNPELVKSVVEESKKYGLDPAHVLTAMSYETGGTLDPWKLGPTTRWGQHRGLIQWGEPQRAQYGVDQNTPVGDQVKAAFQYLKDRGVRPGAPLMDIYSAINAGRVGRNNARDAAAGGAPGTVADKVNTQMSGHAARARSMLQKFGSGSSANAGYASAIPTAAGLFPDSLTPQGNDDGVQRFADGGLVRAIPEDDYETWAPRPDNEVRPPRRPQALPVRNDVPLPPPRPQEERVAEGTPTPPARPSDLTAKVAAALGIPRSDPGPTKPDTGNRFDWDDDGGTPIPPRPSDRTTKVAAPLGTPWKDPPRPFKAGARVPTPPARPELDQKTPSYTSDAQASNAEPDWQDPPRDAYASLPAEPDTGDRRDWEDGGPTPIPNDLFGNNPPLPPRRPTNLAAAPQGAPQAVTPRGKPAPVPPRRPQALDLSYSDLPPRPAAQAAQAAPQTSAPQGAPDYTSSERAGTGGEAGSYWSNVGANHVNDAVHAGLTYLSSAGAGASAPRQAIPTAGQPSAQQAQPLQPPSPQEVQAVDQALDPQKKLTPDERTMARLYGGYRYFLDKGDVQGAQRYAAGMLLHSKSVIGHAGAIAQVALQHGDMQGAASAIAQGYSQLPDGKSVKVLSVTPDGVQYAVVDDRTGQQVDQRRAALNDMMAVATGMSNGSAWLDALEQGFTPQGKPGAAARPQDPARAAQIERQMAQRDRSMNQRDRTLAEREAGGTGKSKTKGPAEPEYDREDATTIDGLLRDPNKKLTVPENDHDDLVMLSTNLVRYNDLLPEAALRAARGLLKDGFQLGENNTVTTQDGQAFRLNPQSLGALNRLKRRADEQGKGAGAGAGGAKPPPYTSPAAERMAKADQSQREVTGRAQADQTQNVRAEKLARNKKILGPDWRDGMTLEQSDRAVRDKVLEESLANPVAPGSVRGSAIPLAPTMGR